MACLPTTGQTHPPSDRQGSAPIVGIEIIQSFAHDATAFTQGLEIDDADPSVLFESTGQFGESTLRRVRLSTGEVLLRRALVDEDFGEGLTQVEQTLWQLTWQNGKAYRYDAQSFERIGQASYEGEGWGLCFDETMLVMSDGTDRLTFRDPSDFHIVRSIQVRDGSEAITRLNELECARGKIYANIWYQDWIAEINPADGKVLRRIDAQALRAELDDPNAGVLNGIAYHAPSQHFYLTGKNWPRLFEVRVAGDDKHPDSTETDTSTSESDDPSTTTSDNTDSDPSVQPDDRDRSSGCTFAVRSDVAKSGTQPIRMILLGVLICGLRARSSRPANG